MNFNGQNVLLSIIIYSCFSRRKVTSEQMLMHKPEIISLVAAIQLHMTRSFSSHTCLLTTCVCRNWGCWRWFPLTKQRFADLIAQGFCCWWSVILVFKSRMISRQSCYSPLVKGLNLLVTIVLQFSAQEGVLDGKYFSDLFSEVCGHYLKNSLRKRCVCFLY